MAHDENLNQTDLENVFAGEEDFASMLDANSHLVFNLLGDDVPTEDLCGHDFDFTLTETNGKRERFADPIALRCKHKKSIKIM